MEEAIEMFLEYSKTEVTPRTGEQYRSILNKLPEDREILFKIFSNLSYCKAFMDSLGYSDNHYDLALTVYRMLVNKFGPYYGKAMHGLPKRQMLITNKTKAHPEKIEAMKELADDDTRLPLLLLLRYGIKTQQLSKLRGDSVRVYNDDSWTLHTANGVVYPITTQGAVPVVGCDRLSQEIGRILKHGDGMSLIKANSRETIRRNIRELCYEVDLEFEGIRYLRFLDWPAMHHLYHG